MNRLASWLHLVKTSSVRVCVCVYVVVGGGVKDTCGWTSEASLTSKCAFADVKKSPLCDAFTEVMQHVDRLPTPSKHAYWKPEPLLKKLDREIHYSGGGRERLRPLTYAL